MEEPHFPPLDDLPFAEVIAALLDEDQILDPLHLYRLSDILPENLSELTRIWPDILVERRRALLEDLELLTDANTLVSFEPIYRLALGDQDDQVRFFATRAIEVFDTDDLIPHFLAALDEDPSVNVRAVTALVLGKYVYRGELDKISLELKERIENKLLEILDSDQPEDIQRRALEALSFSSRPEVRPQILKAYRRGNEDWLASAVFAMGRSLDPYYNEIVTEQLGNTSPKVRLEAVRACGELDLEETVPMIIDLLEDLPDIREAAIWSLSQIGGEEAGPAIHHLLDEDVSDEEADLIQQALERLDFLEDGVNLSILDLPLSKPDDYILDDYDYQQDGFDDDEIDDNDDEYGGSGYDDDADEYDDDGFDDDDIGLENFNLDDDHWLE